MPTGFLSMPSSGPVEVSAKQDDLQSRATRRVDADPLPGDALFCADGQWTLLEFKTDRVRDQVALTALLADTDYVAQVTRYLDAAEPLLGAHPRPVLCFLNVGGAVRVVTELWG